jgi:RNA polymerase sigma-70 factor (ECF subfamily)
MRNPGTGVTWRPASSRNAGTCGEDFVCTFNQVRPVVVSKLLCILGNHDDAQDAMQEAFLKCWRRLEKIKGVRNLRGWIFRVSVNTAKDLQRNTWRCRVRPLTHATHVFSNGPSPQELAENREDQRRLQAALLDLRPEEQEVYLLRMNSCLTYEEIAELRNCPVGTVKTQMRTAIAKLREVLRYKELK